MPAPNPSRVLVGRAADCREIEEMLDRARAGRGGALLLRGEAGIGKTALLQHAHRRAIGMTVLSARGIESESEIPFSGLSELLRPLLARIRGLPDRQAAALAGALALGPPTGDDPFAVAAATLSLIAAAAADGPVVAVVDDLQWVDTSSAEALLFAARRLDAEPAAMLLAERDGEPVRHLAPGFPVRTVTGLDRAASLELLATAVAEPVPDDVAERIFVETGGNPLALLETPGLVPRDLLVGADGLDDEPLPVSERIARAFERQVAVLPVGGRAALLLAAANDAADVEPVLRALPSMGLDMRDLEAAEVSGLIRIDGPRAEFRHPLVRSCVYHGADPARRRDAHRALAGALVGGGDEVSARRAWHLAAATVGQDDAVAAALEQAAVAARHRSGYAAAARTYERSGRLTTGGEARARRLVAAARAWQMANRVDRAMGLLDEAATLTADRLLAADIEHERARIDTWRGPALAACARLSDAAEALREVSPGRSAAMLSDATLAGITGGDLRTALAAARRAHEVAAPIGGIVEVNAELQLAKALILTGDVPAGHPMLVRAVGRLDGSDVLAEGVQLAQAAPALLTVEEYALAERVLLQVVAAQRAANALGMLAYSLGGLAELEARTGRWAASAAHGGEAVHLAGEAGQAGQLSYNLARLARLEAAQGKEDACRARVARALELAARTNFGSTEPFAHSALGLLALGQGRLAEAILRLEATAGAWERIGLREPGRLEWQADLVEALVRSDQPAEAERRLAELERQADACVREPVAGGPATACTLARAAIARCRGLEASAADLDATFEEALAWHAWTSTPFELARTELCFGEQLRRHGRRIDARVHLRAAFATFEQLAAAPWSDRARSELAATGETVGPRRTQPIEALTPQELQVALLVAGGATNREAGAALFLTPKTIEFHLAKIYRKLDLRSRTELARWVAPPLGGGQAAPSSGR